MSYVNWTNVFRILMIISVGCPLGAMVIGALDGPDEG